MSRHRNIRQLGLDDIATYDEALASSVDDDYGISPNTAATYLYDSSKRGTHSFAVFGQGKTDSFEFSVEDFPVNEDTANTSPGHVTGRIQSNGFKFTDEQNKDRAAVLADMELNELMVGGSDYPLSDNSPSVAADAIFLDTVPRDLSMPLGALVEIDFDSLEKLTSYPDRTKPVNPQISSLSSKNAVPNFSTACAVSSPTLNILRLGPHYEGTITTHLTRRRTEVLTASSKRSTTRHTAASGIKEPSRLGSSLLLIFKQRGSVSDTKVNSLLLNSLKVFVRSRTTSTYTIGSTGYLTVKFFRFDVPEPVTFDRRKTPTQTKPTIAVPRRINKPLVTGGPQNIEPQRRLVPESREQATPTALAQTLSERLEISQLRERTPARCNALAGSVTTSPGKPIDRKPLLKEYLERQKNSNKKEVINLIVVGHVDAGKSTLMGNLLCQLGQVSSKQLAKYRWEAQKIGKASFYYAWILDQTSEERTRGVTMDIAQTSFETKSKRIALMDAPGHKDFVPRVIGGASQADVALLVVNATNGEFETGFGPGGQTKEHARLARLLGVSRLIVAVNKMDTVNWDQMRFEAIKTQMISFLKALNLINTVFCPVSGLTGVNVLPADAAGVCKAPEDPEVNKLCNAIPAPERAVDGPFRFVVSDIFKPDGLSVPAIAGRVISGAVSAGVGLATSRVFCQPSGLPATVKSIRSLCNERVGSESGDGEGSGSFLDQVVKFAFAGDQVALILTGVDPFQSLVPGDLLTDPDNPVSLASRIQAKILVFSVPQPITRGYPVIFYYHCTSVSANLVKLKSMTHKENKIEKTIRKPRCLQSHCTADVEITLDRPVCLEVYEKCKPLGRFMLRVGGESIAGGTVTSVLPPKKNRLVDM
ncbi:hypothetical protein EG68_09910 [Paragonimus skrjabini miyazakii]|uniref:Tr-type G domain-containing protein n=1 Tax=Paragonimus skrjabini miyazakii TaxID=59628 RepID=A0A8S9YCR8_9TREM|nr:hypothetical protein EG68_09910 [Paragonimus skrjabini miyazakii]